MRILVDADACPKAIKEILYRAAKRVAVPVIFYANQPLSLPPSPHLKFVLVGSGFDVADNVIMQHTEPGDLVITADIPLAAGVIDKKGFALNPRGEFYTTENVRQRLQMRNIAESMREAGHRMTGPSPLNSRDLQDFANALDRFLAKREP